MSEATDQELLHFLNSPFASPDFIEAVLEVSAINDIGQKLSVAILRARDKRGGFISLSELDAVRGIGPARIARMRTALAGWLARRNTVAAGERFDPDLPSTPFDLVPVEARAAGYAHMMQHLIPPLQAGAQDRTLLPDVDGRVVVPPGARFPLIITAPRRALAARENWRITATIAAGGEPATELAPLIFAPFTEPGAFLPVATAGGEDGLAPELVLNLAVAERTAGMWKVLPAPEVSARIQLRLVEGNLGRLLFALGAEKPRLRRAALEIAASRHLVDAAGTWLDRHGEDLGVVRLSGQLAWRKQGGGSIAIDPSGPEADERYRVRLGIYRGMARRTASAVDRVVNGQGGTPGALAAFGFPGGLRVLEDSTRPPVALLVLPPGASRFGLAQFGSFRFGSLGGAHHNLLAALRRDILIRPDAVADAAHGARPLSTRQVAAEQTLRSELRNGWGLPADAAFAPMLAIALSRAGRLLAAFSVPASERIVLRAQDGNGGSRYELGLGAEVARLAPARWDALAASLVAPPTLPEELAALLPFLRGAARPATDDPDGTWFWRACGFATIQATPNGLYLSHLHNAGLVVVATPDGTGFRLQVGYDPPRPLSSNRTFRWSALSIGATGSPPVVAGAGGSAHVVVSALTAVIVSDATLHEGTGPYTYQVLPEDGRLLDLAQYELLLNLLLAGNPIGVEINTEVLRQRCVDADGDGLSEPLTIRAANSFRRWRRSAVRSRDKSPDHFPDH